MDFVVSSFAEKERKWAAELSSARETAAEAAREARVVAAEAKATAAREVAEARSAAAQAAEEVEALRAEAAALRAALARAQAERDAVSRIAGDWARGSHGD